MIVVNMLMARIDKIEGQKAGYMYLSVDESGS